MSPWAAPPESLLAEAGRHPLFARCGELMAARLGLRCPPETLVPALEVLAPGLGCVGWAACLERLLATPLSAGQLEILARQLCVGETYFFREPGALDALRQEILPALMARRQAEADQGRPIRFWSAGCSTGEEAWSIAILLDQALPAAALPPFSILATDIDPLALAHAAEGVYGEWSFRGTTPDLKESYFLPTPEGRHRLLPRLRSRVNFARLNLAEDAFPAPASATVNLDVIFCRNVLMYFQPQAAQALVDKLARCLVPGGWLVVGTVEASLVRAASLQPRYLADAIFFRKAAA